MNGFKTFTCAICGKTGLTKRNTYAHGDGRICREHRQEFEFQKLSPKPELNVLQNLLNLFRSPDNYNVKAVIEEIRGCHMPSNHFYPRVVDVLHRFDETVPHAKTHTGELVFYDNLIMMIQNALEDIEIRNTAFKEQKNRIPDAIKELTMTANDFIVRIQLMNRDDFIHNFGMLRYNAEELIADYENSDVYGTNEDLDHISYAIKTLINSHHKINDGTYTIANHIMFKEARNTIQELYQKYYPNGD